MRRGVRKLTLRGAGSSAGGGAGGSSRRGGATAAWRPRSSSPAAAAWRRRRRGRGPGPELGFCRLSGSQLGERERQGRKCGVLGNVGARAAARGSNGRGDFFCSRGSQCGTLSRWAWLLGPGFTGSRCLGQWQAYAAFRFLIILKRKKFSKLGWIRAWF